MRLLLASSSPRRKELLQGLSYVFDVVAVNCDEAYPKTLAVPEIAQFLAEAKSSAFGNLEKNEVLLTADTIVAMDDQVLGKPQNPAQAIEMLRKLSGRTHHVFTAVCIRNHEKQVSRTDVATVEFGSLSEAEIASYVERYKPLDKAGGYGIQEWIGMAKIKKIEGSFYTVMGLPTHLVYEILKQF